MFHPTYSFAPRLLENITFIERLYGQIEALRIPQRLELNLTRDNLVQSSYSSNRIEGNPLTLPEVTNLLLDDRVPANRDEKEVVNYFNILKELESYKDKEISLPLIEDLHKKLMTGVDKTAGTIRDEKVVIGKYKEEKGSVSLRVKHDPPFHDRERIKIALQKLAAWTNASKDPAVIHAGVFHHQFVYIHPFEDGNGRVCRLLTALIFIKRGYQINKYFVLDDYYDIDRSHYSDMLHSADNGDKTKWLTYFSDGVKYSLQSALARVENAMKTVSVSTRPTPKEQKVLNILQKRRQATSTDIAKDLHVSRQQAHSLLKALVEKGFLTRKGATKASFYEIK